MSESAARSSLVKGLRNLDAQPVENRLGAGTPDVNHIYGWIELKYKDRWPARGRDHVVKFPHTLQPKQKVWIRRRVSMGGGVALCAKVGQSWLFYDCKHFELDLFNNMTQYEMIAMADIFYKRGVKWNEVSKWLMEILP